MQDQDQVVQFDLKIEPFFNLKKAKIKLKSKSGAKVIRNHEMDRIVYFHFLP